ncbi:hypothetical protein AB5I41_10105 [Sphingomonas sp. MMS24-JH45]
MGRMGGFAGGSAAAQRAAPVVQDTDAALAQDAAEYAVAYGVAPAVAVQRLRAQEASVAVTDRIAREQADRLAEDRDRASARLSHRRPPDRERARVRGGPSPSTGSRCRSSIVPAPRQLAPNLPQRWRPTRPKWRRSCRTRPAWGWTSPPDRSWCRPAVATSMRWART